MDYAINLGTAGWGVWHSPDAGKSWTRHRAPFTMNSRIQALAVVPGEQYTLTDVEPDFVVLGETRTYSFTAITKAIRLIHDGARFIATNPDVTGPSAEGPLPATGSVAAMITKATGREPYFVGKPNPMMFRSALNRIEAHSESTVMVGDRMDTDVVAGIEAGLETILVLTGSTTVEEVEKYPFRPSRVLQSIADAIELV